MNHRRNRNREGGRANHSVGTAGAVDLHIWQREMLKNFEEKPKLLRETAGTDDCCIFRVPQSLIEINEKAYQPRTVSIGPYHHGSKHLNMIEEHKWRFLRSLLERNCQDINVINNCFETIASWESSIRECYSESNDFTGQEIAQMMVLDGCFIIELASQVSEMVITRKVPDDPIFRMEWILPFLMRDLLKLENQIPLFVLEYLFLTLVPSSGSLSRLILQFFSDHVLERPESVLNRADHDFSEAKHLLDLVRLSFSPALSGQRSRDERRDEFLMSIQPAEKLHRAGIQFTRRYNKDSLLDIKFSNGVLRIPRLTMDDTLSSFILNSVAFEQCYGHCNKFMTDYATFMGCLIHTSSDAGFLSDHKIVENCFGSDEEVARFFANVGKDVAFDIGNSYLSNLIEDVNEYYWNDWNVTWASFKYKYFSTPWSFISALAASILLLLTMIQTLFSWLGYAYPHN